jgi:UDP-N-acetylmuramyl pentapeptide phosphotransferase/UDP-N-acetylglucosamine-1-phosphate transferase
MPTALAMVAGCVLGFGDSAGRVLPLELRERLLRRAPLHRHFELMGWSQMQVAQRFWLISMITGLLGVALALK